MSRFTRVACALLLLGTATSGAGHAEGDARRWIRYAITAVEESGGGRSILSETVIEGPPGTDFDLALRGDHFTLEGRFVTDLVADRLEVSADLESQRLHGTSERGLPLHEQDEQRHSLAVGFDQTIALLPFGAGREGRTFKIEIAPAWTEPAEDGAIQVRIERAAPAGLIDVVARRIPHRFMCRARLLERGVEVARGEAGCRLGRTSPVSVAGITVALTVDRYTHDRPRDLFRIRFDVDRAGPPRQSIARGWAGAGVLGGELRYDLGGRLELRLTVDEAP